MEYTRSTDDDVTVRGTEVTGRVFEFKTERTTVPYVRVTLFGKLSTCPSTSRTNDPRRENLNFIF